MDRDSAGATGENMSLIIGFTLLEKKKLTIFERTSKIGL